MCIRDRHQVNAFPMGENPVKVRVVGEQFKWNMYYPGPDGEFGRQDVHLVTAANPLGIDRSDPHAKDDFVFPNELHLPVDRSVVIEVSSKDVIHNFALYSMRIAQDAIPGSRIPMWFKPVKMGEWEVICGQLCGAGHYAMKATVIVESPADYAAWIASQVPKADL